jgi:choline dehydrogenase-like flavoprotein
VDARYSVLHTLADERLLERPELALRDRTVVARLRVHRRRVVAIECVGADGERSTIRANTVVLAANGIENPGLLLRSDLGGDDVGRWLYDHIHRPVTFGLDRPAPHGRGNSLLTGHSFAWADGEWRARRSALEVSVFNPGLQLAAWLAVELAAGSRGAKGHRAMRERFDRTLVLDTLSEDLPRRDRFVELSPQKDRFGLPKNRIRYGPDSDYVESALPVAIQDLRRRLQPLGGRNATIQIGARGGHQLGTCYMGDGSGVVDPNLRHHQIENLYITGGSAFPTYSAHHPTLTIAALAIRLGRHLAAQTP